MSISTTDSKVETWNVYIFLQSLEDFCDDDDEYDDRGYEEDNEDEQDYFDFKDERKIPEKKESGEWL